MAFTGRIAQYADSVKYAAVSTWAATTAKNAGDLIRPTAPSSTNERIYVCIVGGTTGSTQPSWGTSKGDKNTDGTVTWQEFTGEAAGCGDLASTPSWNTVKNTNVSQGHVIKDNAGTHIFIASTANANSGNGAEPSWNTAAVGNTTVDNGVTWTYLGTGYSAWQAPHASVRNATLSNWASNAGAAIDPAFIYVAKENADTVAANISWSSTGSQDQPLSILCVDHTGSLPPVAADLVPASAGTHATCETTGNNQYVVAGHIKVCYGIEFIVANGGNGGASWAISENLVDKNFEECIVNIQSTGGGAGVQLGWARCIFKNCAFKFNATGQGINNVRQARFINCTFAPTGSVPSILVQMTSVGGDLMFEGCDLSTLTGSTLVNNNSGSSSNRLMFLDCKFPSSYTTYSPNGSNSCTGEQITVSRCTNAAGDPVQFEYWERAGSLIHDKVVYRDQGASENGVAYSWRCLTTSHSNLFSEYFDAPPLSRNNTNVGTNVIATIYGVVNGSAVPDNSEICFDLHYLGTSGNDQGTIKSNRIATVLTTAAAHSSDTSDWDNGLTARQNSHAYTLGQTIKLASNPGRIFFCTTAGTSAGSEPGGYASAVDGGSVTDGSAVFRAGVRFKMTVTATSPQPQLAGLIYAKMKIGKQSTTYYIDPYLSLT